MIAKIKKKTESKKVKFLKFYNWSKHHRSKIFTFCLRKEFGALGRKSLVHSPFYSKDLSNIFIGENCQIHAESWIDCVEKYENIDYNPRIEIGDGSYIGHRTHIIACGQMKIGKNVLFADGIYISDNLHGFEDLTKPIISQPLKTPGPVVIEDEVWLGEGVCVLPNVTIGKHAVIGSNSVVTKDIPAYCVAVGSPAKVIRRFDFEISRWVPV